MSATGTSNAGGHGGSGGQGGEQGGGGGTGEGPIVHQHFPSSTMAQVSQLLNHCPPPSRNFHGRQTILDAMHQFFIQDTGKQKIYVLHGLGGAGKTQIALKFIEKWTHFTDRLLVDGSTTETIDKHLKNIAAIKQTGNSVQDALYWLLNDQKDWLLFFDNADDPAINLNQFFPKCNHGNIIITSRNPNLQVYGAHSQVSDMDEPDAVALLLKSAHQEVSETNKAFALDIVKTLWYLPLAIVQAGAFIFESGTLNTYLDLFRKNQTELLKKKPVQGHDDYTWAVYTTWEMSFCKLSQPAAMLLQLCSLLHRDNIFEQIFSRAAHGLCKLPNQLHNRLQKHKFKFMEIIHAGSSPPEGLPANRILKAKDFLLYFMTAGEWDSFIFLKVINEIKAYSLINFDQQRNSFSMHPLVHSWSRTTLDNLEAYHLCINEILGTSIEEIPAQDMPLTSLTLVSHVDSLMQVTSKPTDFQSQYASVYFWVGRYTEAENLDVMKVEKQTKLLGDDHLDTLNAMYSLAVTYDRLGRWEQAEALKIAVLEKRRKLLGDDHLDTVHAMYGLAATYNRLRRFEDAEKLEDVVLEKRKKLLGGNHLDTLQAMQSLGITYRNLGRLDQAEKLQVVVLEKLKKLLGDEHLDTLKAMHSLAVTYNELNRWEDAEKLQVAVLERRTKLLGDDHPDTLTAMSNLGCTHCCQGDFLKAEELQVVVLEKRRKLLGDDHPDTHCAMGNLVKTYYTLGKETEAEEVDRLLYDFCLGPD
ncbi:P-loop containing nucleoside triphosphate hydrolase protein [Mycena sanguinolenta]|nr:P-loop containing nucleoside triphosphate hydrolase protein [Mycena sanguinolenta]